MPLRLLHAVPPPNRRMLIESMAVFIVLFVASAQATGVDLRGLWVPAAIAQGFWFQRLYVVGHEAAHRRLASTARLNDALGQLALLPILVPVNVFRAIHRFHHRANRLHANSAALDVYVVSPHAGRIRRAVPWVLWYLAVFCGGWFVHGLVSVVLFLFVPPRFARHISPAFAGWTGSDQRRAVGGFALGLALHVAVYTGLGPTSWWACLGVPLLVFAWVYSLQLYAYHYRTTMGPAVRFHVRSVRASRLTRWWLLELPSHATHHGQPGLPWYELRLHKTPLPPAHKANDNVDTWIGAVAQQILGPTIVESQP